MTLATGMMIAGVVAGFIGLVTIKDVLKQAWSRLIKIKFMFKPVCGNAAHGFFYGHDCMDAGGRATQDDSMEGIGSVESGTETEQLPRTPVATGHIPS